MTTTRFDSFVEKLCEPYHAERFGRPGMPPGVYFRMLFVGYFEGIDSQRGIAWRCSDSFSMREFLGLAIHEKSPDHSSMTKTRQRLPLEVFAEVFSFVLAMADVHKLIKGKTLGVDSTMLEANAAMKTIVRKDSGDDWMEYLRKLYEEETGEQNPTDEDLRRFDRKRKSKKVSNDEWESSTDADSRIAKMKDGRTHLAYKAENAVGRTRPKQTRRRALITVAVKKETAAKPCTVAAANSLKGVLPTSAKRAEPAAVGFAGTTKTPISPLKRLKFRKALQINGFQLIMSPNAEFLKSSVWTGVSTT